MAKQTSLSDAPVPALSISPAPASPGRRMSIAEHSARIHDVLSSVEYLIAWWADPSFNEYNGVYLRVAKKAERQLVIDKINGFLAGLDEIHRSGVDLGTYQAQHRSDKPVNHHREAISLLAGTFAQATGLVYYEPSIGLSPSERPRRGPLYAPSFIEKHVTGNWPAVIRRMESIQFVDDDFLEALEDERIKAVAWEESKQQQERLTAVLAAGNDRKPEPSMDAVPPADHAAAIHTFLWRRAAEVARTKGFQKKGHDLMLDRLQRKADDELPGTPRVTITQSLQDSGCDLLIDWGMDAKYGVQMKSHHDTGGADFAAKTVGQIQDSRQHGLKGLYVLLAGDLTNQAQVQRVRGFQARVSRMKDKYVQVIPPERLWTLLFGEDVEV